MLRVRDAMTRDVITLEPEESAARAWGICREKKIRHIPIVENDRLVGLVSDRDLRDVSPPRESRDQENTLGWVRVRDIMTRDIAVIGPLDTIDHAARDIYDRKIGCLPVVDHGELVGIITSQDMMRTLAFLIGGARPWKLGRGRSSEQTRDARQHHRRHPGPSGQHLQRLRGAGRKSQPPDYSHPARDHQPRRRGPRPRRGRLPNHRGRIYHARRNRSPGGLAGIQPPQRAGLRKQRKGLV